MSADGQDASGSYDRYGQYGQSQYGQIGQEGQYSQYSQYGQAGQYVQNGQYGQPGQYGQDGQYSQYGQNGQYGPLMMSAAQIISILQQQPDTLADFKNTAAQQVGVDPQSISDQNIFGCIQTDPVFRSGASTFLEMHGYLPASGQGTLPVPGQFPPGQMPGQLNPQWQMRSEPQSNEPRLRQMPVPYPNLPSLRELYSQIEPDIVKLRRFGSDVFRMGTGNAGQLPMDLPAGPDYILGPGDNLILNLWGSESGRLSRTIDRQGQVALPEAGVVMVSGMTITQAQTAIQQALNSQLQHERVEISLGRLRTVRIYVVGDVQRPGAYDISALSTLLNALYAAGGPTARGSMRKLEQYRGKELVREIDLYDFLLHGVNSDPDRLLPGDTVLVPPVGPQVSVAGMVRRPAIYELKGGETLKDILALAGGVLVSANINEIRVERTDAHERHTMVSVNIPNGATETAANIPDFKLQDGDYVRVAPILPYKEQVVYLQGHVYRPGQYAWHEGMTVSDLVHSYQDIMPEPAAHAELVRLMPPDLRPETTGFDISDVLIGDEKIPLQPFDVVRIFSRYEIDPPRVSIRGEVLRPGEYPMSKGMTFSDLVQMAGGFRRSAYEGVADLTSYSIENGQKVQLKHVEIDIARAMAGDKDADAALKPGDVVGIRQLTGWNDIGASVMIQGEVKFAGTYGIESGERLSSVLKRAGGFRQDAYPTGAIFLRPQVRDLEERNRQEMIRRIETSIPTVSAGIGSTADQQSLVQTMQQQRQQVLDSLRNHPPTGRLVIRISSDISKWENTPADIEMRPGDRLTVPKREQFVVVTGSVYNPLGITYSRGRDAGWYLKKAGGATREGDKRRALVIRADGSVVGNEGGFFSGNNVLRTQLRPGDSVVVPEKVVGGSMLWRNLIASAQVASSVAITGAAVGAF